VASAAASLAKLYIRHTVKHRANDVDETDSPPWKAKAQRHALLGAERFL